MRASGFGRADVTTDPSLLLTQVVAGFAGVAIKTALFYPLAHP